MPNATEAEADVDGHRVVVIGASAGGVETLIRVVRGLPTDLAATVCIVLHIAPGSPSALPSILQRASALPCRSAVDGEPLREGEILIAPPDRHSSSSTAAIVQDPADAMYPGMPASAIAHAEVDAVVPSDLIADTIVRIVNGDLEALRRTAGRGEGAGPAGGPRAGGDARAAEADVAARRRADEPEARGHTHAADSFRGRMREPGGQAGAVRAALADAAETTLHNVSGSEADEANRRGTV